MLIKRTPSLPESGSFKIWLNPRIYTLVDAETYEWAHKFHWRLIRSGSLFYAARRFIKHGKTITIRLHREIMNTPPFMECHHKHSNPLDNRKSELENLFPPEHRLLHGKTQF
jgi:hypothetical protein